MCGNKCCPEGKSCDNNKGECAAAPLHSAERKCGSSSCCKPGQFSCASKLQSLCCQDGANYCAVLPSHRAPAASQARSAVASSAPGNNVLSERQAHRLLSTRPNVPERKVQLPGRKANRAGGECCTRAARSALERQEAARRARRIPSADEYLRLERLVLKFSSNGRCCPKGKINCGGRCCEKDDCCDKTCCDGPSRICVRGSAARGNAYSRAHAVARRTPSLPPRGTCCPESDP